MFKSEESPARRRARLEDKIVRKIKKNQNIDAIDIYYHDLDSDFENRLNQKLPYGYKSEIEEYSSEFEVDYGTQKVDTSDFGKPHSRYETMTLSGKYLRIYKNGEPNCYKFLNKYTYRK